MPNYTGVRVQIPPLTPAKRPGSYLKVATFFVAYLEKQKTTVQTALRVSILITNQEIAQAIMAAIWSPLGFGFVKMENGRLSIVVNVVETLLSSVNSKVYWFSPLLNIINPLYS